jgi:hypothetical protein
LSHWVLVVCTTHQLIAASRFVRNGFIRYLAHLINMLNIIEALIECLL